MSRSMPTPWLKPTTLELISDVHEETGIHHSNCKPKLVQVIRGNENLGTLLIHDKEQSITAFLTQGCLEEFRRSHPHRSLVSLRGSLVKLDRWHVSTVVQCAANRPRAVGNGTITFPLCIQVAKLTAIGADDCNVFGDPKDINRDPQILEKLRNLSYLTLAERLSERQFQASHLPDVEGQFSIPHHYSKHYQLRWHHAIIVEEEERVLNEITEFEPVETIAAEKIREYEAEVLQEELTASARGRKSPHHTQGHEANGLEGTKLRFTQNDSEDEDLENDVNEFRMLSQSQRVMTFITQEPLSQQNEITDTQDSVNVSQADGTPVRWTETQRRQRRKSSVAPSQPLSPMTLDLFASIQEGTEWYTQPLTQSLLSTLEEAWGSQDTTKLLLSPAITRRPQTPSQAHTHTAALYGSRVVPSSARTPDITHRPPSASRRPATQPARRPNSALKATPTRTWEVDEAAQPAGLSSTQRRPARRVRTARNAAHAKRQKLDLFSSDEDLAESEIENNVGRRLNARRLSSKLLRPSDVQSKDPPLFGLVQDALDRLLGDTEPMLMGRDAFGNLVMHSRQV